MYDRRKLVQLNVSVGGLFVKIQSTRTAQLAGPAVRCYPQLWILRVHSGETDYQYNGNVVQLKHLDGNFIFSVICK